MPVSLCVGVEPRVLDHGALMRGRVCVACTAARSTTSSILVLGQGVGTEFNGPIVLRLVMDTPLG
jgi:hypothetical protein